MLLSLLRSLNPNRVAHTVEVTVIVTLATFVYSQHTALMKVRAVYTNPKVVVREHRVLVQGPVRVVTKIIESPAGKETTIVEDHAPTVDTVESSTESAPVPINVTMAEPRTDRWLLGASLLDFSPNSSANYRLLCGYSFRNRLDLTYGVGYDERVRQSISVVIRF